MGWTESAVGSGLTLHVVNLDLIPSTLHGRPSEQPGVIPKLRPEDLNQVGLKKQISQLQFRKTQYDLHSFAFLLCFEVAPCNFTCLGYQG